MSEKSPRVITTVSQALAALGDGSKAAGVKFVADLFSIGHNAVRNWCNPKRPGFPPETVKQLAPRLRQLGCEFSDEVLFQQYPAVFKPKEPPAKKKNGGKK